MLSDDSWLWGALVCVGGSSESSGWLGRPIWKIAQAMPLMTISARTALTTNRWRLMWRRSCWRHSSIITRLDRLERSWDQGCELSASRIAAARSQSHTHLSIRRRHTGPGPIEAPQRPGHDCWAICGKWQSHTVDTPLVAQLPLKMRNFEPSVHRCDVCPPIPRHEGQGRRHSVCKRLSISSMQGNSVAEHREVTKS